MRNRFGGLLSLALGAVLIFTGLNAGGAGVVGATQPTTCGVVQIGGITPCPTGQITITSVTDTSAVGAATAPATWTVKITSTCLDPATHEAVDQVVNVPNKGTASSTDLYVYTDSSSDTECSYNLYQNAVAGFTTTFDPPSPVTLPSTTRAALARDVTLTNVALAVKPTPTTSAPSTTAPASTSSAPASASPSSSSAPLAATGPRTELRSSVWIGSLLCLLGLVLLFGGRVRRSGRHGADQRS